jgi:hypothetical protein
MGRKAVIDWNNIQRYREEYNAYKAQGLPDSKVKEYWGIKGHASFQKLKKAILRKPERFDDVVKKMKRKYEKKAVTYETVPIVEAKSDNPIFCLVVGFESKEAAFKAMGQL